MQINRKKLIYIIILSTILLVSSAIIYITNQKPQRYYVSPSGSDSNEGTISNPFKTIGMAVSKANNYQTEIIIQEGNYDESIDLSNKRNIQVSCEGTVTVNGTAPITSEWINIDINLWKTTLSIDIWQLFVDNELATYSRWPNAQLYEEGNIIANDSIWNRDATWRKTGLQTEVGKIYDERPTPVSHPSSKEDGGSFLSEELPSGINTQNLSNLAFSVENSIAIMNIGNWITFVQHVDSHSVGNNYFTYSSDFSNNGPGLDWDGDLYISNDFKWLRDMVATDGTGRYYLEGKKEFLDSQFEWFFNKTDKSLYIYSSIDPNSLEICGKARDFSFFGVNVKNVELSSLNFWGTTLKFEDSTNITVKNSNFTYYATSKRPLGDVSRPSTLSFYDSENIRIINNRLKYTDGIGIIMDDVTDPIIFNNYFQDIDFSSQSDGSDSTIKTIKTENMYFGYNTIIRAGNSETIRGGTACIIEYNYVSQGGLLQWDGAAINISPEEQSNSVVRYNWIINTSKAGIRFDGVGPTPVGINGKCHNNVVMGATWSNFHGDYHLIYNNTMLACESTDLVIAGQSLSGLGGTNPNSIISTNFIEKIGESFTPSIYSIQATLIGNIEEKYIATNLTDINSLDFRISPSSSYMGLSIGAYQDVNNYYFIPGYQEKKASSPIPYSGYNGSRDDIIFKLSYNTENYTIYLSESIEDLYNSPFYETDGNIVSILSLTGSKTYFWQVDSNLKDGSIINGDIWNFTLT